MGSSAKRKREKKQDFKKTKLKVGKTNSKPSNFTSTSFQSKSIVLHQQSLRTTAPSQEAQFAHHLSLLSSHSDSQCRDSLAYLTNTLAGGAKAPQPWAVMIPKLLPLMTRTSSSLRTQLIKLFHVIPAEDVQDHVEHFTLYLRAAMTSLSFDIRADGFEVLNWLLDAAGNEVVTSPGGWTKPLKCFVAVFAWDKGKNNAFQLAGSRTLSQPGKADKGTARQLQVFGRFLQHGISLLQRSDATDPVSLFPLWHTTQHLLPDRTNCFAYLNLFGPARNEESDVCEERQDRQRVLWKMRHMMDSALLSAKQQGGELGRVAGSVRKIWQDGMKDYKGG